MPKRSTILGIIALFLLLIAIRENAFPAPLRSPIPFHLRRLAPTNLDVAEQLLSTSIAVSNRSSRPLSIGLVSIPNDHQNPTIKANDLSARVRVNLGLYSSPQATNKIAPHHTMNFALPALETEGISVVVAWHAHPNRLEELISTVKRKLNRLQNVCTFEVAIEPAKQNYFYLRSQSSPR